MGIREQLRGSAVGMMQAAQHLVRGNMPVRVPG